jgi:hypothetical protein
MRSFAAVLLRRLVFRPVPPEPHNMNHSAPLTIYDHLSENTRFRTERALLRCLREESVDSVRKKVADTITDLALGSMERGRPWPELQSTTFECTQSCRIFASTCILMRCIALQVRHAALRASSAYLTSADPVTRAQAVGLMNPILDVWTLISAKFEIYTHCESQDITAAEPHATCPISSDSYSSCNIPTGPIPGSSFFHTHFPNPTNFGAPPFITGSFRSYPNGWQP